jgi:hypothetical protein
MICFSYLSPSPTLPALPLPPIPAPAPQINEVLTKFTNKNYTLVLILKEKA